VVRREFVPTNLDGLLLLLLVQFDYGGDVLAEYLKVVRHPALACNMDVSKVPALKELVKPYTVLTKNGVKVGPAVRQTALGLGGSLLRLLGSDIARVGSTGRQLVSNLACGFCDWMPGALCSKTMRW
jgi:hypothetical protein